MSGAILGMQTKEARVGDKLPRLGGGHSRPTGGLVGLGGYDCGTKPLLL